MAVRLIILWICLAAISAFGSWFLASRAPREALWVRIGIAAVLLIGCVASFLLFGNSAQKTFAAVALYFSVWSTVFVVAAASAGTVVGTLIALQFTHRKV
ncbi:MULTISPECIES: hypothetical protein [Rhodopseudomonas]|uniref:Uncharacterized protein n=1 Tax=Rhodopseudomonas palustris TaxID=1076 RepID=A0A0D7DXG2_RHOPL|nr:MULTISPECIES: hypothetical protein [Rhodopseudomonas]KIZ32961.1 hypothetical protein OO17_29200 [Rhodopseudomonas palustris]MDF3811499.1 hypothetical protein [Rhodopseudomonas sp. BAL398]WOK15829.1 hypothetical protein RBJ75_16815 [Rhodopseudomonas sp. BAL398]